MKHKIILFLIFFFAGFTSIAQQLPWGSCGIVYIYDETGTVNVSKNGKYELYNSFTPNNDGLNDCFGVRHLLNISNLEFSIFDRWGQRVFYTKNAAQCWDGTFKGLKLDTGVYIYILKGTGVCGALDTKGTVLLIR